MADAHEPGPRPAPDALARWVPWVADDDPRNPSVSHTAATVWDGLVWGRLGRSDRAWACWDQVTDPALVPWIAAERGRLLREFGLHDAAEDVDVAGLAEARDVTDVVMLRLSLAADALAPSVAGRDLENAERRHAAAIGLLDELPPGPRTSRQRLRARWVGLELAMARGEDRLDTEGLPWRGDGGPGFPVEHEHGTDFHRAKSLLFAGVARGDRWFLDRAVPLAPPMLLWAIELARADTGLAGAEERALTTWRGLVPPPGHEGRTAGPLPGRSAGEAGA